MEGRTADRARMRAARKRCPRASFVATLAGVLLLLAADGALATGPTTITFDEPGGTVIDTEYAGQGVRFGKASTFSVSLQGAWDCGAPTVTMQFLDSGGSRRLAQAPVCGGRSGTVAAFAHPRRTIKLVVDATAPTDRDAQLRAYDRSGHLLTSEEAVADGSTVSIDRSSPDVSFLAVQLDGEGTSALLFDDLVFDHLGDPLTLSPRDVGATVGSQRTDNVARLTDADPTATSGDYRARIDWGDGQASDGRLVSSGDGYDVVGSHTYAATGTFTVRTTVEKANGVRATASSTARVVDRPDFAVSVAPGSASVSQGQSARFTVTVTPLAGFTGTASLALAGASGSFAPSSVSVPGTSQLTVSTSASTAPAAYPLTITATSGALSRTATATLTVTKASTTSTRGSSSTVVAKLAVPRPQPALSLVTLDARGTTGATRYLWDLNGDRKPDVDCGRNAPMLGARLRTPGLRTVSLVAVAADGRTSVARRTLGVRKRPGAQGAASRSPEVATCLRDARPYLEGRACAEKVVFGIVEAKGCFSLATRREDVPAGERAAFDEYYASRGVSAAAQARCEAGGSCPDPLAAAGALDPLVARGPVKLNGLTFVPSNGAAIVVFPQIARVVSSRAAIVLGPIRVRAAGPVNLPLSGSLVRSPLGRAAKARLLTFAATTALPELGGFRLAGDAELSLVRRGSRYASQTRVNLALPAVFSLFGGPAPTGSTVLEADNDRGLVLDELSVRVPEAYLGSIHMTNLAFEYKARGNPEFNCPRRWWKATANVFLGSTSADAGFRLAPDPPLNGVAFCNGAFKSAGGEILFGAQIPPPQLFPGVYLTQIGFGVQLDPTVLIGTATISAARLTEVKGAMLMAFPSQWVPYAVPRNLAGLARLGGRVFFSPTIAVGGAFRLKVSDGLTIPFGDGYVAYSYPDYVAAGGSARFVLPGMTLNAGIDGEMSVGRALFSFHGFAEACIAGIACLVRADAWVTSTGVVVCGSIAGELHPGAGIRWGEAWPDIWLVDGCKPSRYWVDVRSNRFALAPFVGDTTTTFTVRRGERTKNVRLDGVGGAPRIEVRGPGGELVSTAAGDFATGRTIRILRQDGGRVTWIGVQNAASGMYTVTTLPGSVGIARLAATRLQDEHVRVTLAAKDSARLIRYDVARVPGRRVTFFERGGSSYQRLGSVAGGRGTLRFSPAAGSGGRREILARVELDGVPAPDHVVARYRLQSPKRLTRPSVLRLRRSATSVVASWKRVPGAVRYGVVLGLGGGLRRAAQVASSQTRIRLGEVPSTQGGTVTVRALSAAGAWGPPATASFTAPRRRASAFRPLNELGRRRGG
jgi:hypothetical protein